MGNRSWWAGPAVAVAIGATGCGGGAPSVDPAVTVQKQADGFVTAMQQLADAVAAKKEAEIDICIEALTSSPIDGKRNPEQAKAALDIYTKGVKGKLKGDDAGRVRAVVDALEKSL